MRTNPGRESVGRIGNDGNPLVSYIHIHATTIRKRYNDPLPYSLKRDTMTLYLIH